MRADHTVGLEVENVRMRVSTSGGDLDGRDAANFIGPSADRQRRSQRLIGRFSSAKSDAQARRSTRPALE
jgi:hypothetical protein